jgi:DNA-binding transcriptional regulator YiaG
MNTEIETEHQEHMAPPERYHYRDSGLDNVWLEGGFEHVKSPYGDGVRIEDLDGLHRCIARCLIEKPGLLSGAEFRFLRTELDLSQSTMGQLCGREERAIRGWEAGDRPIDEGANKLIRFVYEQRFNPTANTKYEELSKKIEELQALDKKLHELKLVSTAAGWTAEDCLSKVA